MYFGTPSVALLHVVGQIDKQSGLAEGLRLTMEGGAPSLCVHPYSPTGQSPLDGITISFDGTSKLSRRSSSGANILSSSSTTKPGFMRGRLSRHGSSGNSTSSGSLADESSSRHLALDPEAESDPEAAILKPSSLHPLVMIPSGMTREDLSKAIRHGILRAQQQRQASQKRYQSSTEASLPADDVVAPKVDHLADSEGPRNLAPLDRERTAVAARPSVLEDEDKDDLPSDKDPASLAFTVYPGKGHSLGFQYGFLLEADRYASE